MSTHAIEIVEIGEILPHPNPEVTRMQLTHVWGWQCCIGKDQFSPGDKAIYIPPDFEVPLNRSEFAFLRDKSDPPDIVMKRVRIRRFKGALSQGLLVKVPEELAHLPVGTNVISEMGIRRYEPQIPVDGGFCKPPDTFAFDFDVETFQRYHTIFAPGEEVVATEKMDGTSARFLFLNGQQFCGTRNNWMEQQSPEDTKNPYWRCYNQHPDIGRWCSEHSGLILYGEVFGSNGKMKYGAGNGVLFLAAFGILAGQRWLDFDDCLRLLNGYDITWAPIVYRGPFDAEKLLQLAEEDTSWPGAEGMREGIVVVPVRERRDAAMEACGGRVSLKIVSNRYLS